MHSQDFEDDVIPIKYLFRKRQDMPEVEQKALDHCRGKVLDVGCGAGSHALELQKNKELQVKAIDTSIGAVEVAHKRGVLNVACQDFFDIKNEKFDTILMLMNGSGIIGKLENLNHFFHYCKTLLNTGGQVLMDSSDLIYLFDEDFEEADSYYGEFQYRISYKETSSDLFDWLFIDAELLKQKAELNDFNCQIILEGENHDYLACLTIK